jgi:hypothetical protein
MARTTADMLSAGRPVTRRYTTQAAPIDLTAPINHRTTVSGLINEYRRAA